MSKQSDRRNFSPLEQAVVDGYLSQLAQAGGPNHWTWMILDELVTKAPERAWPLLVEIISKAPDSGLPEIGAGPLEDLLDNHGPKVISAVEAQAAKDARFRLALAGVWQGRMSKEVFDRVQVAAPSSLIDDLVADPRSHTTFMTRRLELWISGRPPTGSSDTAEHRQALDRLAAAVAATPPEVVLPFRGSVILDLTLDQALGSSPVDPTRLLVDIVRALRRREVHVLTDPTRILRIDYRRGAAHVDRYHLEVIEMSDDQLAATEDPRDLDEVLESMMKS